MTDITAPLSTELLKEHFPLGLANDGSPIVPTNPELAKARLAVLHSDNRVVDQLLNPKDVLHQLRTAEVRGLQIIAAGAPGAVPATPKV